MPCRKRLRYCFPRNTALADGREEHGEGRRPSHLIRTAQFPEACFGDGCRPLISGQCPFRDTSGLAPRRVHYLIIGYNSQPLVPLGTESPLKKVFQAVVARCSNENRVRSRRSRNLRRAAAPFCAKRKDRLTPGRPWACNCGHAAHIPASCSLIGSHSFELPNHFPVFGGVMDSTLGWSAPLPVESRGSLVKSPATKIIGNTEEMPLAA